MKGQKGQFKLFKDIRKFIQNYSRTLFFLLKMNKKIFGLDIGATTMKLVALSKDKTGYLLNNAIIAPSPPKGMLSQSPIDEEEMANAIKKAIEDAKIVTKSANIALAENQVYTKVIEMPNLSDRKLSSAIYCEAEQQIPVPLSNITLVWNVLERNRNLLFG